MRSLLLALLVSLPADAQISGSLTAHSDGGDTLHLALDVHCELACSPVTLTASDIEWRYSVLDGGGAFLVHPELDGGHFEFDGSPPRLGTALTFSASASCVCGALDSGVISLTSSPLPVVPLLHLIPAVTVNQHCALSIAGFPQGDERIDIAYLGAGLDGGQVITHAGADFTGGNNTLILSPTSLGDLSIIATLEPYGASISTLTHVGPPTIYDEMPGDSRPKSGCSTAPGASLLAMLTLLSTRRRRSR
jgi:hypothetical protein